MIEWDLVREFSLFTWNFISPACPPPLLRPSIPRPSRDLRRFFRGALRKMLPCGSGNLLRTRTTNVCRARNLRTRVPGSERETCVREPEGLVSLPRRMSLRQTCIDAKKWSIPSENEVSLLLEHLGLKRRSLGTKICSAKELSADYSQRNWKLLYALSRTGKSSGRIRKKKGTS